MTAASGVEVSVTASYLCIMIKDWIVRQAFLCSIWPAARIGVWAVSPTYCRLQASTGSRNTDWCTTGRKDLVDHLKWRSYASSNQISWYQWIEMYESLLMACVTHTNPLLVAGWLALITPGPWSLLIRRRVCSARYHVKFLLCEALPSISLLAERRVEPHLRL